MHTRARNVDGQTVQSGMLLLFTGPGDGCVLVPGARAYFRVGERPCYFCRHVQICAAREKVVAACIFSRFLRRAIKMH